MHAHGPTFDRLTPSGKLNSLTDGKSGSNVPLQDVVEYKEFPC